MLLFGLLLFLFNVDADDVVVVDDVNAAVDVGCLTARVHSFVGVRSLRLLLLPLRWEKC